VVPLTQLHSNLVLCTCAFFFLCVYVRVCSLSSWKVLLLFHIIRRLVEVVVCFAVAVHRTAVRSSTASAAAVAPPSLFLLLLFYYYYCACLHRSVESHKGFFCTSDSARKKKRSLLFKLLFSVFPFVRVSVCTSFSSSSSLLLQCCVVLCCVVLRWREHAETRILIVTSFFFFFIYIHHDCDS
jgi:hypothetical protein